MGIVSTFANLIKKQDYSMKNIFLIFILGTISFVEIPAQDVRKMDYQLDVGTILTIPYRKTIEILPEFEGHPKTAYTSDFGYLFEFLVSYSANGKYSILTGLNYNYFSLKINDKIGLIENKGNLTSSYFTLPILIKYRLSDKIPFTLSAGPYIGYLVNANEKGTSYIDTAGLVFAEPDPLIQSIEPVRKYNTNIKKDFTSIDYGLSLQLEFEIKLNKLLDVVILTRFNCGLKDIVTNDLVNNSLAGDWKNYNLTIGLGLKL